MQLRQVCKKTASEKMLLPWMSHKCIGLDVLPFKVCTSHVISFSVWLICIGIWERQIELSVLGPSPHAPAVNVGCTTLIAGLPRLLLGYMT